jgi:hypothetical protein
MDVLAELQLLHLLASRRPSWGLGSNRSWRTLLLVAGSESVDVVASDHVARDVF